MAGNESVELTFPQLFVAFTYTNETRYHRLENWVLKETQYYRGQICHHRHQIWRQRWYGY